MGREETDSPKKPFWTTVSPHDAFAAPLARSDHTMVWDHCLRPYGLPSWMGHCIGTPNPYNLSESTGSTPPICTVVRAPFLTQCLVYGTSQARRRQLKASSGGSSDATSKASCPLHNTEARQHQGNLDVTSDVVLSCCCCPSTGADCWLLSLEERETQQYTSNLYCNTPPICTAVRLPFVAAILLRKNTRVGGSRNSWWMLRMASRRSQRSQLRFGSQEFSRQ